MKTGNIFDNPDQEFDLVALKYFWSDMFYSKAYYPYENKKIKLRLSDFFERILLPPNDHNIDFVLLRRWREESERYHEIEINTAVCVLLNALTSYNVLPIGMYFTVLASDEESEYKQIHIDLTFAEPSLPEVGYRENTIHLNTEEFVYREVYEMRHGKEPLKEEPGVTFMFKELKCIAI